ncbi:MAG: hypothetical protein HWN81_00550 [Candidatus Lokiarchaeota archaeon]|nr:hypothetical protein [Candidatus Lokiarchaeota archaeon]
MNHKCPLCKKEGDRVILRQHWSKKYYEFICGHCKIEFSFIYNEKLDVNVQLKNNFNKWLIKVTGESMEQSVKRIMETMTEEEMLDRLDELNQVYH